MDIAEGVAKIVSVNGLESVISTVEIDVTTGVSVTVKVSISADVMETVMVEGEGGGSVVVVVRVGTGCDMAGNVSVIVIVEDDGSTVTVGGVA